MKQGVASPCLIGIGKHVPHAAGKERPVSTIATKRPLKIGAWVPIIEGLMDGATPRWADVEAMARTSEDIGLDSIWMPDHLLFRFPDLTENAYECMSMLAAVAAATRRVEIGTLVACTGFRSPAMLASIANTIDEISGGRLILGLGAGYHEPEYRAFGFPYDHRASRFEEAIHIIATLLRERKIDYEGRFYSAQDCELGISGPRANGPPIMVGTVGARMLHLTAQYADLWNRWLAYSNSDASAIPPLRERVDAACAAVGRDPATLGRTISVRVDFGSWQQEMSLHFRVRGVEPKPITGSPEEIAGRLRAFADVGISHLQIWTSPCTAAGIEMLAPVLELLDQG
jgi:alkanesulfonate monooxygenase SsuD/methylene tetrahydromethanopterin reductase-like flavin-dependent oxidoreductase (luciferase family)